MWKYFETQNLDYSLKYFIDDCRRNVDWCKKYYTCFRHLDIFMTNEDLNRQRPMLEKVQQEAQSEMRKLEEESKITPMSQFVNASTCTAIGIDLNNWIIFYFNHPIARPRSRSIS